MLKRQFTGTTYVLHEGKTLLLYHKKLGKWLPPGGHVEEGETPAETAIREAYEETGLHVSLIRQENVWIDRPNAVSFERPYLCLLENVPAYGNEPAHQHIDFVYLSELEPGQVCVETDKIRWFTPEEAEKLESEIEIFEETKQTLRHVFAKFNVHAQGVQCCLKR